MNAPSRKLLFCAGWLLPLLIGIIIGRQTSSKALPSFVETPQNDKFVSEGPTNVKGTSISDRDTHSFDKPVTFNGSLQESPAHASALLADILNISGRVERTRQLLAFVDQLNPSEFESVIAGFTDAGWVDFNRAEFSFILSSWMSQDPLAAVNYLKKNEGDGWSRKVAISAWAAEDPEAATNAVRGLKDEGKVNDWVVGLIQGIARNDPHRAVLALQEITNGDTKKTAIREMLPEVVSRGTDFASEWIELIDDSKLQLETAGRLGGALANRDPESAAAWVAGVSAVETRRNASEIVAEIYASQDLDSAKSWVESLPQDTLTEAAEGVTKHLSRKDPAEAARWLQTLGTDTDLDGARIRFIRESMKTAPEITLNNIHTLSRPDDQERYYRQVLGTWAKLDKNAAISWAQENSESLSERVYKSIVPKNLRNP
ncbi:hypothetical protein N9Z02_00105 [Akkermansiaceae bacterium]|nr:hypothetical protein [Akkermansiaceae bacterium]